MARPPRSTAVDRAAPSSRPDLVSRRRFGYKTGMMTRVAACALLIAAASSAMAANRSVTVVNQTGGALKDLAVRAPGASDWKAVAPGLSPGARTAVSVDDEAGCSFDVRATSGGGQVVWSAINFCETRSVSLNRRGDGLAWADYD